ncbi:HAD family hydrolase [Clostridium niameyense]|uniref:HAD family hydrolase n=1 Tax=Clostridium niameyense TaxID=1622073 RepID=A0A6M0R9E8_9CLOT|nr:Cof-type HAD-IIB family hydrolase [Clostridium niameyense]NEZ46894.1 HAD family hydrolase [Clostridium niameyense]
MIKLIATDLDGTLINDKGIICEKIFNLINILYKKDIKFVAASGRFYSQLVNNFDKADKNMIFIAHNGAIIKYNKDGQTLYSSIISKEDIESVKNLKLQFQEELFLAGESKAYTVKPSNNLLERFNYFKVDSEKVKCFNEVEEPIYKLTYYCHRKVRKETLEYLEENLSPNLEFVVSGDCWIDIMNKGVSKGNAIKILQEKFNISEKNTMVFGDYYNDIAMFKKAYYSYAMENAPEDVKQNANFIAESNNNNGVYNVINDYINKLQIV